jgi:osmotically-inducible protein OsmY
MDNETRWRDRNNRYREGAGPADFARREGYRGGAMRSAEERYGEGDWPRRSGGNDYEADFARPSYAQGPEFDRHYGRGYGGYSGEFSGRAGYAGGGFAGYRGGRPDFRGEGGYAARWGDEARYGRDFEREDQGRYSGDWDRAYGAGGYAGMRGSDWGFGGIPDYGRWDWTRGPDYGRDHGWRGRGGPERGFWDKATDEVSSWFGDEEAERRRRQDQQRGRGPKGYTRSDERIREDVSDRLTDDWRIDASNIEVMVANGEVTLNGTVESREEKRRAEDIAESVSGVSHVQNNLRVQNAWRSGATGASAGAATSGGATGTSAGARTQKSGA